VSLAQHDVLLLCGFRAVEGIGLKWNTSQSQSTATRSADCICASSVRRLASHTRQSCSSGTRLLLSVDVGATKCREMQRRIDGFLLRRTSEINQRFLPDKTTFTVFCRPSLLQVCRPGPA